MGLDMYLTGERYLRQRQTTRYPLKSECYDLGYWRKHPNLHGYIVKTFADGEDHCQEIELDEARLRRIIKAVERTTGSRTRPASSSASVTAARKTAISSSWPTRSNGSRPKTRMPGAPSATEPAGNHQHTMENFT